MANQEQNNLNAYEQFKQRFAKYSPYLVALKNFQEKDDIKGLKKLAIEKALPPPENGICLSNNAMFYPLR